MNWGEKLEFQDLGSSYFRNSEERGYVWREGGGCIALNVGLLRIRDTG